MSYLRPHRLEDALDWLAAESPLVMAGCTDIYPLHQTPSLDGPLLDITGLDELRGITAVEGWRRFGAATSWTDILRADLPAAYDGLKAAAREIGGVQIQASGTIGGNLCTASPAGDSIPCLMTLNAEIELASHRSVRRLPLNEFLTGPRQTACAPDELVTAVYVPSDAETGIGGFEKLGARRYLVISIAMTAARLSIASTPMPRASSARTKGRGGCRSPAPVPSSRNSGAGSRANRSPNCATSSASTNGASVQAMARSGLRNRPSGNTSSRTRKPRP